MEHYDWGHEPMPIRSRAPKGGLAGPPTGAESARMWAGLSFVSELFVSELSVVFRVPPR